MQMGVRRSMFLSPEPRTLNLSGAQK